MSEQFEHRPESDAPPADTRTGDATGLRIVHCLTRDGWDLRDRELRKKLLAAAGDKAQIEKLLDALRELNTLIVATFRSENEPGVAYHTESYFSAHLYLAEASAVTPEDLDAMRQRRIASSNAEIQLAEHMLAQIERDEESRLAAILSRVWALLRRARSTEALKVAIRQAKRELGPGESQHEICVAADRILKEKGTKFRDVCQRGWRGKSSLLEAYGDEKLRASVKVYISRTF